jgi:hypothetical protein
MPKMHTRKKRLMGLSSGKKHRFYFQTVKKKTGDRTFRTSEQADAYAKESGVKSYDVIPAKKDKRFKIVAK